MVAKKACRGWPEDGEGKGQGARGGGGALGPPLPVLWASWRFAFLVGHIFWTATDEKLLYDPPMAPGAGPFKGPYKAI